MFQKKRKEKAKEVQEMKQIVIISFVWVFQQVSPGLISQSFKVYQNDTSHKQPLYK